MTLRMPRIEVVVAHIAVVIFLVMYFLGFVEMAGGDWPKGIACLLVFGSLVFYVMLLVSLVRGGR
jgi:hypothetical protein